MKEDNLDHFKGHILIIETDYLINLEKMTKDDNRIRKIKKPLWCYAFIDLML